MDARTPAKEEPVEPAAGRSGPTGNRGARKGGRLPLSLRLGVPALAVLAVRLPYFGLDVLNSDEGLYALVARAIQRGGLPYRDAWDHAAPGIFYLYRSLFDLFGPWSMGAVRLAALAAHIAGAWVVGEALHRRHGDRVGVLGAAFAAVAVGGYLPADAVAALTETFLLPFLLAAAWLLLSWAEGGRARPAATGILIALATWFKIHALLISLVLLLAAWAARMPGRERRFGELGVVFGTLLAALAAYLLLCLPMFIAGGLPDYLRMYIGYNLFYLGVGEYDLSFFRGLWNTAWQWALPQMLIVALAASGAAALLGGESRRRARGTVLLAGFLAALLAALAGARLFGHYFLPAAAFAGWLAGEGAGHFAALAKRWGLRWSSPASLAAAALLFLGLLQPVVIFHGDAWSARVRLAARHQSPGPTFPKLIREIRELALPAENIWIWGFAPEIYLWSRRDCSSRFINDNYLVGLVPWVNAAPGVDTTPWIIPGSWPLLQKDLTSNPPALIVDAAAAGYQFWGKYPLRGQRQLEAFIRRAYLDAGSYDGFRLYLRRDLSGRLKPPLPGDAGETGASSSGGRDGPGG